MRLNSRERSSDIERAREAARRLRGNDGREAGPTAPTFVRFAFGSAPPPAAVAVTPQPAEPATAVHAEPALPAGPARTWAETLARCVTLAGGEAAIVVDATGLVIAASGDWHGRTPEQVDALGARMQISVDQAQRIDEGATPVVAVALTGGWLTGLRVETTEGPMALGIFAKTPVAAGMAPRFASEIGALLAGPTTP